MVFPGICLVAENPLPIAGLYLRCWVGKWFLFSSGKHTVLQLIHLCDCVFEMHLSQLYSFINLTQYLTTNFEDYVHILVFKIQHKIICYKCWSSIFVFSSSLDVF